MPQGYFGILFLYLFMLFSHLWGEEKKSKGRKKGFIYFLLEWNPDFCHKLKIKKLILPQINLEKVDQLDSNDCIHAVFLGCIMEMLFAIIFFCYLVLTFHPSSNPRISYPIINQSFWNQPSPLSAIPMEGIIGKRQIAKLITKSKKALWSMILG